MLNKHYEKGLKAKELLNVGNEMNPYKEGTREYLLWSIGNSNGVYVPLTDELIELPDNDEIFKEYE